MARQRRGRRPQDGPLQRTERPAEEATGRWTALLLAAVLFLAPAVGVPHEEMLQDTLKSIVVAGGTLLAALAFFWQQRQRQGPLRWHAVLWLPLLLMAFALGSMAWSHTYLAGVETIRWFVFSLLVWLGLNSLTRERLPLLAWGIHGGAVVASLWVVLQFWFDFRLFPQGPNPASTFINRNFFAEFAVCTLPFSALLLARARQTAWVAAIAVTTGLVIVALLMTGTRSALAALWLLLLVLPLVLWKWRAQLALGSWRGPQRLAAFGLLLAVLTLGSIPTGNQKIQQEQRGDTALQRGLLRTASISTGDASLGIRLVMWKATARMIRARPLAGVGAGAWENEIPLYQAEGSQLETDYYVHNEFLQLLAEDGLVGWIFLLLLFAYLLCSAWRTWRDGSDEGQAQAPWRAGVLCSLLALLIVSNAGFPWRMAASGALFAACLGTLAASDARLGLRGLCGFGPLPWRPAYSRLAAGATVACLALAFYISQQAAQAEWKIVRATRLALAISSSGDPGSPRWDGAKSELLRLIREGTQINPHYRKITPMVADEMASWGDWRNAIWIWESVLSSRPHIVAILTNVARGYASIGEPQRAFDYLARAKELQPDAPSVRSLEVVLLSRSGHSQQALALVRNAIRDGAVDYDIANAGFLLASQAGDFPLAIQAMELRLDGWPQGRATGYVQLGKLYADAMHDSGKAIESYRKALELTPPEARAGVQAEIPREAWRPLGLAEVPPPTPPQMSVISR
jgi:O-antigen ligase